MSQDKPKRSLEIDIMNKWVLVSTLESIPDKEILKYPGNSFLGFVYIDHQCGTSLMIQCFCDTNSKEIKKTVSPLESGQTMYIFRFDVIENMTLRILDPEEALMLGYNSRPDWVAHYTNPNLNVVRNNRFLDRFRYHGFPDDIQVLLPPTDNLQPELVFGRLEKEISEMVFECQLLNEPNQKREVSGGDLVIVTPYEIYNDLYMLCLGTSNQTPLDFD
ncbi:hypothetical protein GKODMF_03770 [Candidatus Electrothrix gigas]